MIPRERTLAFLRGLVMGNGAAIVGLSDFMLSLETAGLIVVHWRRHGAGQVAISEAGRKFVAQS